MKWLMLTAALALVGCNQDNTCYAPPSGGIGDGVGGTPIVQGPNGGAFGETADPTPTPQGNGDGDGEVPCSSVAGPPKDAGWGCEGNMGSCYPMVPLPPPLPSKGYCWGAQGSGKTEKAAREDARDNCADDLQARYHVPWDCSEADVSQLDCDKQYWWNVKYFINCDDIYENKKDVCQCMNNNGSMAAPTCDRAKEKVEYYCSCTDHTNFDCRFEKWECEP